MKAHIQKNEVMIACSQTVDGAPATIKLLPLGMVKSQKGNFLVDKESFESIKRQFESRGVDIVIDYEHQTLDNVQAPAGGWIKEVFMEDNAIAAKVEWTPKAAEYLANKEYRYLSPVVLVRKSDGKATMLHSAALTNTPAIDNMFAIVNSINTNLEGGNGMDELLKKLAQILGLGEDATEDAIVEKLQTALQANSGDTTKPAAEVVANKTICGLLGVAENAKTEDVAAAIVALKTPSQELATDFAALKLKLEKRDADDAVLTALKLGKIAPAQKEWATGYALKDPAGFAAFVEKAVQVVPQGEYAPISGLDKTAVIADEGTLAVCKLMGLTKEDIEKYGKVGE